MEQRRVLNSGHVDFDTILRQLADKIVHGSIKGNENEIKCIQTQIEAYFTLSRQDIQLANAESFNLSNPKELFCRVEKQAISEGYINELTSILSNLLTIPATQSDVWHNISRIVGEACHAKQVNMLKDSDHDSKITDIEENYFGATTKGDSDTVGGETHYHYPNYEALRHLLNVKASKKEENQHEKNGADNKNNHNDNNNNGHELALKTQLEKERNEKLKLEKEVEKLQNELNQLKTNPQSISSVSNGNANSNTNINMGITKAVIPTPSTTITKAPRPGMVTNNINTNNNNSNTGDDGYNKYRTMLKIRQPRQSVVNRMIQDGIDATIIAAFEDSGVLPNGNAMKGSSGTSTPNTDAGVTVTLTKAGQSPVGIGQAGLPAAAPVPIAPVPVAPVPAVVVAGEGNQCKGGIVGIASELSEDDEKKVSKYRKMLKINIPKQSVMNRMIQDGVDKALIDKMFGKSPTAPCLVPPKKKATPSFVSVCFDACACKFALRVLFSWCW